MDKIKWGIIGPGSIANNFADGLTSSYSGQLVGIASKSADRRKSFGDKYNIHEGKTLGSKLKMIEEIWVGNNFNIYDKQVEKIAKS